MNAEKSLEILSRLNDPLHSQSVTLDQLESFVIFHGKSLARKSSGAVETHRNYTNIPMLVVVKPQDFVDVEKVVCVSVNIIQLQKQLKRWRVTPKITKETVAVCVGSLNFFTTFEKI